MTSVANNPNKSSTSENSLQTILSSIRLCFSCCGCTSPEGDDALAQPTTSWQIPARQPAAAQPSTAWQTPVSGTAAVSEQPVVSQPTTSGQTPVTGVTVVEGDSVPAQPAAEAKERKAAQPSTGDGESADHQTSAQPSSGDGGSADHQTSAQPSSGDGESASHQTSAQPSTDDGGSADHQTSAQPSTGDGESADHQTSAQPSTDDGGSADHQTSAQEAVDEEGSDVPVNNIDHSEVDDAYKCLEASQQSQDDALSTEAQISVLHIPASEPSLPTVDTDNQFKGIIEVKDDNKPASREQPDVTMEAFDTKTSMKIGNVDQRPVETYQLLPGTVDVRPKMNTRKTVTYIPESGTNTQVASIGDIRQKALVENEKTFGDEFDDDIEEILKPRIRPKWTGKLNLKPKKSVPQKEEASSETAAQWLGLKPEFFPNDSKKKSNSGGVGNDMTSLAGLPPLTMSAPLTLGKYKKVCLPIHLNKFKRPKFTSDLQILMEDALREAEEEKEYVPVKYLLRLPSSSAPSLPASQRDASDVQVKVAKSDLGYGTGKTEDEDFRFRDKNAPNKELMSKALGDVTPTDLKQQQNIGDIGTQNVLILAGDSGNEKEYDFTSCPKIPPDPGEVCSKGTQNILVLGNESEGSTDDDYDFSYLSDLPPLRLPPSSGLRKFYQKISPDPEKYRHPRHYSGLDTVPEDSLLILPTPDTHPGANIPGRETDAWDYLIGLHEESHNVNRRINIVFQDDDVEFARPRSSLEKVLDQFENPEKSKFPDESSDEQPDELITSWDFRF